MPDTPPTTTTITQPWHHGVEADTLTFWQNKGYNLADPKEFATQITTQYRAAERHLGVPADQLIRMPKDAADEAGIRVMRQKLGVPDAAAGYDLAGIKRLDGSDLDAAFTDTIRGALHRAGVSKDAAAEFVKSVVKHQDDAATATATERTAKLAEQKAALQKNWGTRHDENILAAKQGARRLGISQEHVAALESVIGYDGVMEMFRKVGAGTSEDTFVNGGGGGGTDPKTQAGAQARLTELQNDKAWVDRLFKKDANTVREFNALMEQIAGVAA